MIKNDHVKYQNNNIGSVSKHACIAVILYYVIISTNK